MNYSVQQEPEPIPNDTEPIAQLMIYDLEQLGSQYLDLIPEIQARYELGLSNYGVPLQVNNGRDAIVDAFQEAIDLALYLKQCVEEDKGNFVTEYRTVIEITDYLFQQIKQREQNCDDKF